MDAAYHRVRGVSLRNGGGGGQGCDLSLFLGADILSIGKVASMLLEVEVMNLCLAVLSGASGQPASRSVPLFSTMLFHVSP